VHELFDEMAFDDARSALDGVRSAEYAVDYIVIVGLLFQFQEAGFHRLKLLSAFLNEDAGQFIHAY
jgi:hypothetical protein